MLKNRNTIINFKILIFKNEFSKKNLSLIILLIVSAFEENIYKNILNLKK